MKEIKLTMGQVALVDDEDFDRVNAFKWCVKKFIRSGKVYYYGERAIKSENGKQKHQYIHQFIIGTPEKGLEIDHIDGNKLNNQKINLRVVTHQQNMMNKRKLTKGFSIYKGVYLDKRNQKWNVKICINWERIHLGTFTNEEDAGRAYDIGAIKYYGEYARLNFPITN
jgi:hypothetical protein